MKFDKQKYLEHYGLICPYCDSKNINADCSQFDDNYMWRSVVCEDCKECWTETYMLIDAHSYDE